MIVYGDPQFSAKLSVLLGQFQTRLAVQRAATPTLEGVRTLLISSGQLEQAAFDSSSDIADTAAQLHSATAYAAEAFYGLWRDASMPAPKRTVSQALNLMAATLEAITCPETLTVKVKLPEGFSFYTLYPEQYAMAALHWLGDHTEAQKAVVVGIRSIGTTLGAVVSSVLQAGGWQVQSFSVRPTGHPHERQVQLPTIEDTASSLGVVVDEGPGISGSSMATTAEAFVRAGIVRESISFLPGHGNEPGQAASDDVRRWWATTPRYVTKTDDPIFAGGKSLPELLSDAVMTLACVGEKVVQIEDLSGGLWRQHVFTDQTQWPAVNPNFERIKYRCTTQSGLKILWKFGGLGSGSESLESTAEAIAKRASQREANGLGPDLLGTAHGFVATRWVEGTPMLQPRDVLVIQLREFMLVGRYILRVANLPLSIEEHEQAVARLEEMLYWNTWEALGEAMAEKTRLLGQAAKLSKPLRAYGDGHLSPHEWIRRASGQIVKVDGIGHDQNHTIIGRQSIAWDIAGLLIEWDMETDQKADAMLNNQYTEAGDEPIPPDVLLFYKLAYSAFRVGVCHFALSQGDRTEQERNRAAYNHYCQTLKYLLERIAI